VNTTTTPDQTNATEAQFLAPETHQRAGGQSQASQDELQYVPLNKLLVSPLNVRKSGGENVDELAALIASQGLLQNLVAVPHTTKKGKATDKFEVVAGGRRLRALIKLAQVGTLAPDEQILCKLVSRQGALAISAAENSGREAMSAADTVQAFADMVNNGATVEEVSVCFGITPLTVRRRLKLATVSPRLFDLFREGTVSLEQMMALAVTDDHGRQEAAWEGAHEWDRQPHALRRALLGQARSVSDPLVRFVGLDVYEAAGGVVVRDLFAQDEDESAHVADAALLDLLVKEKLAGLAADVKREGWGWTETAPSFGYSERNRFREARAGRREPTSDEATRIEQVTRQRDEASTALEALYDAEGGEDDSDSDGTREKAEALEKAIDDAEAELRTIHAGMEAWSAEVMAHAGAMVSIDHRGEVQVLRGLVRPEDREQAAAAQAGQRKESGATECDADEDDSSRHHYSDSGMRGLDASVGKARPEFSDPLMRRLTAHRTKALQVLVADNAQVALAVLAHTMVQQVIENRSIYRHQGSADITVRSCDARLTTDADDLEASPAWVKLRATVEAWGDRLPGDTDRLLPWLIGQPQETLVDLLALCTALTLDAGVTRGLGNSEVIAEAVGLDMADWWAPTAGAFLAHVPKAKLADAVREAVSEDEATKLGKLKKGDAVAKAEALLASTRWLPTPLRSTKAV
jgi:ParB family chromosome partitioning protein